MMHQAQLAIFTDEQYGLFIDEPPLPPPPPPQTPPLPPLPPQPPQPPPPPPSPPPCAITAVTAAATIAASNTTVATATTTRTTSQFRAPLAPEDEAVLLAAHADVPALLAVLRDLLLGPLSDTGESLFFIPQCMRRPPGGDGLLGPPVMVQEPCAKLRLSAACQARARLGCSGGCSGQRAQVLRLPGVPQISRGARCPLAQPSLRNLFYQRLAGRM